jgi:hypothetical protein
MESRRHGDDGVKASVVSSLDPLVDRTPRASDHAGSVDGGDGRDAELGGHTSIDYVDAIPVRVHDVWT